MTDIAKVLEIAEQWLVIQAPNIGRKNGQLAQEIVESQRNAIALTRQALAAGNSLADALHESHDSQYYTGLVDRAMSQITYAIAQGIRGEAPPAKK